MAFISPAAGRRADHGAPGRGRNGLEHRLAYLGVRQKNGSPGHPQTQGKIERFHQTLKRRLGRQPAAPDLAGLQAQLDAFQLVYNEQQVTVVALDSGEILSTHRIEPEKGYWRNTRRDPGRWPGSQGTG